MAYFKFKGVDSTPYLIVNKLPAIIKPKRDVDIIDLDGRSGFLTRDKGTYRGVVKSIECTIKGLDNIDYITTWLNGSGDLILSNEPDKVYRATIINQIEIEKIARLFYSFILVFDCQPFKYEAEPQDITLTTPNQITNPGNIESEPKIKVTGSGDVTLNVGDYTIQLTAIGPNITIDSEIMDCYRNSTLLNDKTTGPFPKLKPGENAISWSGNVTKLEITPRWRWI